MGNEEVDLVTVAKPAEKKTLLERYDIPVEHLSYEYITECTNGKELERIVLILRSGEEGVYPDLTKHAEERLLDVNPNSKILRVAKPILTRNMLQPEVRSEIDNDIDTWMNEMQNREKDLKDGKALQLTEPIPQPEIRRVKVRTAEKARQTVQSRSKEKRLSSCDYDAWDKYDVDTELNRIDLKDDRQRAEAKRMQQKWREAEEKGKKLSREALVDKLSLTSTELNVMAEQEKDKGNEAFRAGDYEEALQLYNSSIAMEPTINAYNNRALTYIKLQRYDKALNDCNRVLNMEYTNVKGLLRRGLTLEHLEKSSQALADYEAVLKLNPADKTAIAAVNRLRKPCESRKVRMKIEEERGDEETKVNDVAQKSKGERRIDTNDGWEVNVPGNSRICFCDRAPGPSHHHKPLPHMRSDYCLTATESDKMANIGNNNKIDYEADRNDKKSVEVCFCDEAPGSWQHPAPLPHMKTSHCSATYSASFDKKNNNTGTEVPKFRSIFTEVEAAENVKKPSIKVVVSEDLSSEIQNHKLVITEVEDSRLIDENKRKSVRCREAEDKSKIVEKRQGKESQEKPEGRSNVKDKQGIDFSSIRSPYEFLRMWQSLKNDSDLSLLAHFLRSSTPEDLSNIIGNKLDGTMLSVVLRCLEQHFCSPDDAQLVKRCLISFGKLSRFTIVNMFMDNSDKKVLKNIFAFLEKQECAETPMLRQMYSN